VAYVAGKLGKAFLFGGSSYVRAPVVHAGPMTIDLWVRATDPSTQLFASALSTSDVPAASYFQIDSDGVGNWRALAATGQSFGKIDSTVFQHLALTYDGTMMRTYYEGKPVGTPLAAADLKFTTLKIGVNRGGDVGIHASVDEVHLWDRALTDAEIAELHDMPKAILCP
jgi:hypothetical protein